MTQAVVQVVVLLFSVTEMDILYLMRVSEMIQAVVKVVVVLPLCYRNTYFYLMRTSSYACMYQKLRKLPQKGFLNTHLHCR